MKKMYQTMKEAIVGKLPWIVGAIIVIQPLLDVLSYFLGEMGSNSLSTALRFLLLMAVALLGFLVSVTFYRCPHCHRVLPANRGKMDDCPYCKLPLRDTK